MPLMPFNRSTAEITEPERCRLTHSPCCFIYRVFAMFILCILVRTSVCRKIYMHMHGIGTSSHGAHVGELRR